MAVRMWFIAQKGEVTDESSRELCGAIRECGGLILMATRTGPLVALMGPVALNPRGLAADRLERIFAENLGKQLDPAALGDAETAR